MTAQYEKLSASVQQVRGWWVVRCSADPKLAVVSRTRDGALKRAEDIFDITWEHPEPEAA